MVFVSKLKDQLVRGIFSAPFRVVDTVFKSTNLLVQLGDVELLQGVALDSLDAISASICHNPWAAAHKNELDHTLVDFKSHLRQMNKYSHPDVTIRSVDIISRPDHHDAGRQQYALKPRQPAVATRCHRRRDDSWG